MQKLWETRQQVQACTPRQRARGHKTRGRRLRRGGGAAATERRGGEELLEVWGHRHRHPNVDSVYVCMCICVKPIWPELLLMAARGSSTVSAVQVSLEIRAEWRDLASGKQVRNKHIFIRLLTKKRQWFLNNTPSKLQCKQRVRCNISTKTKQCRVV